MKQEIKITWSARDANNTVRAEHREALQKVAKNKIVKMMGKGHWSGRLVERVRDGDESVLYKGWWLVDTKDDNAYEINSDRALMNKLYAIQLIAAELNNGFPELPEMLDRMKSKGGPSELSLAGKPEEQLLIEKLQKLVEASFEISKAFPTAPEIVDSFD